MSWKCKLLEHNFKQISSETTKPDSVIKVVDRCTRCEEEKVTYYLANLLIPKGN